MKSVPKLHMLLAVVLVAAAVVSIFVGFGYSGAKAKLPGLQQDLADAQQRLTDAQNAAQNTEQEDPTPYQQQLASLERQINQARLAQPLFPESPPRVKISDLIVDSAQEQQLVLVGMKSTEPAGTETIDSDQDPKTKGNKYNRAEYEVVVRGDMGRIFNLIGKVEMADFATLRVENVQVQAVPDKPYSEGTFTIVTLYEYTSGT